MNTSELINKIDKIRVGTIAGEIKFHITKGTLNIAQILTANDKTMALVGIFPFNPRKNVLYRKPCRKNGYSLYSFDLLRLVLRFNIAISIPVNPKYSTTKATSIMIVFPRDSILLPLQSIL